jgi:allantoin racemase
MRIDILVPVYVEMWNDGIRDAAQRIKAPDTEIHISNVKKGIPSIECEYDVTIAAYPTLKQAELLEKEGTDAIIIYCFNDPALTACKEKLSIPVIGLRESSIAYASLIGMNIGIITSVSNSIPSFERILGNKIRKVGALDIPVLEFLNLKKVGSTLEKKVQSMISEGCDVIVLGCGSIMGIDFSKIEKKYGIPIVVPVAAAVSAAEYMVRNKISQSKIAYPSPPKK